MSLQYVTYDYWDYGYAVGDATNSDICGPFSLEELDQFGTLDALPFSLDSEIWESPNTCIMFFAGTVNGAANVTAAPTRVRLDSAAISGAATVSGLGGLILSGTGSITANGTVTADGVRVRGGTTSITGDAEITALGGVIYNGTAYIEAETTVICFSNAIWSGDSSITSNAAVSTIGYIYGEEWTDVTEDSNVWSIVSANSNTWTNLPAGTNTWLRQN